MLFVTRDERRGQGDVGSRKPGKTLGGLLKQTVVSGKAEKLLGKPHT